ncbi:MAG: MFS transporter, partial [Pseudomonadota bacterium]
GGAILLLAFVRLETRLSSPLIEVWLFRIPTFSASSLTILMAQYSKMPIFVFSALYAQDVLGFSPLKAGLFVMLSAITQPFVAPYCGKLVDRHPPGALATGGLLGLTVAMALISVSASSGVLAYFLIGLVIAGLAAPFLFVPTQTAIMASLPEHKHGQGGSISMTSQMMGGTLGLAICSVLFSVSGSYVLVFASTAGLLLLAAVLCHLLFRRPHDVAAG